MTGADVISDIVTRVKSTGTKTYIRGKCDFVHLDRVYDPIDGLLSIRGRSRIFTVTADGGFQLSGPIGDRTEWAHVISSADVSILYELGSSVTAVIKAVMEDRDSLIYALTRADLYPSGVFRRSVQSATFDAEGEEGSGGILSLSILTEYKPEF